MGLSDELRSELAAIAPDRGCCRLAEVSALFHSAGSVHLRGRGRIALHLDVATSGVARRAFSLLRQLGIHSEIRTYSRRSFDRSTRYQLHVSGDEAALATLVEAGVLDAHHAPLERPPKRVVGRSCCRGAYLRGALLGGGSLSGPRSPHLELRTTSLEGAEFLRSVAAADDVRLGVLDRGRHAVAYAKGLDAIESVLTRAGATDTVLAFEERSIVAAARGEANRLANADHANLVRTSRAAQEQLEAVRALQRDGALERLPERLHEVARLRLRYPQLPLRELAAKCEPPTTRRPSTAACESCRSSRPSLSPGSEATLQGSWREPGSPLGDSGSDCAPKSMTGGPEGELRGRPPPPRAVLRCRRRTGSEFDDGRARTRPSQDYAIAYRASLHIRSH